MSLKKSSPQTFQNQRHRYLKQHPSLADGFNIEVYEGPVQSDENTWNRSGCRSRCLKNHTTTVYKIQYQPCTVKTMVAAVAVSPTAAPAGGQEILNLQPFQQISFHVDESKLGG